MKIQRALLSVSDKGDLVPFAKVLVAAGVEIISTGGTAKALRDAGLTVKDISEYTGFPEMLDGRIKTLHPKVHGGLLYIRGNEIHEATVRQHGIQPIDLVVVNLYPFEQTVAKPDVSLHDAIENIDIGGPSMLRSAAKNHDSVTVVVDPADYAEIAQQIQTTGQTTLELRHKLATKVFARTSTYDGAIDQYLSAQAGDKVEHLTLRGGRELAYGENKCQSPAFIYSGGGNNPLAISKFQVVAGNPSFIAMADASQLVSTICLMTECFRRFVGPAPFIAIAGKHGNPCGAGVDWRLPGVAMVKALRGDPTAVMGGELITNFSITDELGQLVHHTKLAYADPAEINRPHWGLDEVLAPAISERTVDLLGKKEKRRLLVNPALANPPFPEEEWTYRELHGGDWLKQRLSRFVLAPDQIPFWTGKPLGDELLDDLIIAFACCWRASSNTVALAKNRQLIGLGCGQQDRIACVRLCLDRANRARHDTKGSIFASDAFFPYASAPYEGKALEGVMAFYNILRERLKGAENNEERTRILDQFASLIGQCDRREGPQLLADAGCIGGIVPADGKELLRVQQFFSEARMRVAFVAPENRGFAKH